MGRKRHTSEQIIGKLRTAEIELAKRQGTVDVFDYIERFHNPRRARRTDQRGKEEVGLTQLSVEKG